MDIRNGPTNPENLEKEVLHFNVWLFKPEIWKIMISVAAILNFAATGHQRDANL